MISRQLAHLGCDVEMADDGMQACVAVMKTRFDAVLMDCHIPRVDGFHAAKSIREHERSQQLPRVPIIAVSASILPTDRDRGIAAGMDELVLKPISIEVLRAVLVRFLGSERLSAAIPNDLCPNEPVPRSPSAPAQPSLGGEQVLDLGALAGLRALRRPGRPNLIIHLITDYLQSSPARIEQLLNEMRSSTPSKGDIAHGLKSISATLGAVELAQTLGRIESAQRGAAPGPVTSELEPLRRQYARACVALERILMAERQIEEGSA
jgi:CheY-like chemotaxis protein